eukprot:tig00000718_g3730.t1
MALPAADAANPFSQWIELERARRELRYQIRQGLYKVKGRFSYCRLEGIKQLLKVTLNLRESEHVLFGLLQSDAELNIVLHVLMNIFTPSSSTTVSPVTAFERQCALELLQGCLLLSPVCKKALRDMNGIEILMDSLNTVDVQVQSAALSALLAATLDSRDNFEIFLDKGGLHRVLNMMMNRGNSIELRHACGDFLVLVGAYFDEWAVDEGVADYTRAPAHSARAILAEQLGPAIVERALGPAPAPAPSPSPASSPAPSSASSAPSRPVPALLAAGPGPGVDLVNAYDRQPVQPGGMYGGGTPRGSTTPRETGHTTPRESAGAAPAPAPPRSSIPAPPRAPPPAGGTARLSPPATSVGQRQPPRGAPAPSYYSQPSPRGPGAGPAAAAAPGAPSRSSFPASSAIPQVAAPSPARKSAHIR